MLNKDDGERFFEESFLFADVKPDIVFGILFLTKSNANIDFQARNLQQRFYTTGNILSTTKQVELIEKKKFVRAALDSEHEAFIVHIAILSINSGDEVYPLNKAQIAHLKADKVLIKVSSKYADFVNIFSSKLTVRLNILSRLISPMPIIEWGSKKPMNGKWPSRAAIAILSTR